MSYETPSDEVISAACQTAESQASAIFNVASGVFRDQLSKGDIERVGSSYKISLQTCPYCGGRVVNGATLRAIREATKPRVTQAEVARRYGCASTFISLVESGGRRAPVRLRELYASLPEGSP